MNNFSFYVLGNFSPNINTFGKRKSTCYLLKGFSKYIFLDFGAGVFSKFLNMVKNNKISLDNIYIIISHNHVDHNLSLLSLGVYLLKYNKKNNKKIKVDVVLPKRSIVFNIIIKFKDVYDIHILDENTIIHIDNATFSFCETIHKGKSYATKIQVENRAFVYTSDIARYSSKLRKFVDGSDSVLIDAGYPRKRLKLFRNYHGITKEILNETAKLEVRKIYATHIRFFSNVKDYYSSFPKNIDTELVAIDKDYRMFKSKKRIHFRYN